MDLELRHLRALVAVAEEPSFTAAASRGGVSQPTLSRTIARLEEIVGCRLVERTTRRVALTSDGESLAAEARLVLGRLERAVASLGKAHRGLRVGWSWAALGPLTMPMLDAWRETSGDAVALVRTPDPLAALAAGDVDAVVVRQVLVGASDVGDGPDVLEPVGTDALTTAHLHTEPLVAGMSLRDPLAGRESVSLAELGARSRVLSTTGPLVPADLWVDSAAVPQVVAVSRTEDWLAGLVHNESVGVISLAASYNRPHPEVLYVPISDSPVVEVLLAWPTDTPHRAVDAFASHARRWWRTQAHGPVD